MNFFAHLHCSPNHELIRLYNFTGDGYRGNGWKKDAEPFVVIGVELHRFIDHFTDQHPSSRTLKAQLRIRAGKTAPIALDLLADYFLHKHWPEMRMLQPHSSQLSAASFIESCTQDIEVRKGLLTGKAARMWPWMKSEQWLVDYQRLEGIKRAALGMSKRHPAIAPLGIYFKEFTAGDSDYQQAEIWFTAFYPQLIAACQNFVQNHPLAKAVGL